MAHGQRSNKLRRVKVIHTELSGDSDVSSLDSVSESLKSEDVFAGNDDLEIEEQRNETPGKNVGKHIFSLY